ncbi:MAG: hypothetical protein KC502_17715 [Myxococcales bacterium]|nr:hypothetical protein [Myxococcales bacterium]
MKDHVEQGTRLAVVVGVVVGVALAANAVQAQQVGPLRFHISPQSADFGSVSTRSSSAVTYGITNNMPCGITFRHHTSGHRGVATVCYGLSNMGEILPGRRSGCRATFRPQRAGPHRFQTDITVGYGYSCREMARKDVERRRKPLIDRTRTELDKHVSEGPKYAEADKAHKKAATAAALRQRTLDERERFLRFNQPGVEKYVTRRTEWLKKVRTRDRRMSDRLRKMQTSGPDLTGYHRVLAEVTKNGKAAVSKVRGEVNKACNLVPALMAEQKKALDELRRGLFCAACKRPPTRIRREANEEFWAHVRRVGKGTMRATPKMLQAEKANWKSKIDAAVRRCNNMRGRVERENERWRKRFDRVASRKDKLVARHQGRLDKLSKRLADVRKQWQSRDKQMTKDIDDAKARHSKAHADAKQALAQAKLAWQQRVRDYKAKRLAIKKRFDDRRNTLERRIRDLQAALKDAVARQMKRLKATSTRTVSLVGVGK